MPKNGFKQIWNWFYKMRKIFIHLHIPKCGGSSVSEFLKRNFGKNLFSCNSILNDYQYTGEQVYKIINHHPNLKCLTGHKLSLDLPFDKDNIHITALCWVRDPVDRFVSHYFYHRNHTNLVPEAKKYNLDEYIKWALEGGNQKMYINGQVGFLSGGRLPLIQKCIEDGKLFLFSLSNIQESFYTLSILFPEFFSNWSMPVLNISKKDQKIPSNIRELVLPYVEDDMKLLSLAMKTKLEIPQGQHFSNQSNIKMRNRVSSKMALFLHKTANWLERTAK